ALNRDSSRSAPASAKFWPAMKSGFMSSRHRSGCGGPGIGSRISVSSASAVGVGVAAAAAGSGMPRARRPFGSRLIASIRVPLVAGRLRLWLRIFALAGAFCIRLLLLVRAGRDGLASARIVVAFRFRLVVRIVFVHSLLRHGYPFELLPSDRPRPRRWLPEPPVRFIFGAFGSRASPLPGRVRLAHFELPFFYHSSPPIRG